MSTQKPLRKQSKKDWLITYSDMVTLLLVFFIAIVATGDTKIVKSRVVLSTFNGNVGVLKGGKTFNSKDQFPIFGKNIESLPSEKSARKFERKKKEFNEIFSPFAKDKRIKVIENEKGVVISLFSDIFFEPNSAKIKYKAMQAVLQNINILLSSKEFNGQILIEGHTDNIPYQGTEFIDNWELSVARSLTVLKALRSYPFIIPINEDKLSVHGFGDTRPVEDNDNPIQRSYNRRVDILLKRI